MTEHYPKQNILTGAELEDPSRQTFRDLGGKANEHRINDSGVDVEALIFSTLVVVECLNWLCGWDIPPERWKSIMENLCSHAGLRILICVGVIPTISQQIDAQVRHVHIIYGSSVAEVVNRLRIKLLKLNKNVAVRSRARVPRKNDEAALVSYYPSYVPLSMYSALEYPEEVTTYKQLFSS